MGLCEELHNVDSIATIDVSYTYLDRGFDLSEPDASFPLLLHDAINDEVLSDPNDGLGTRFLPVKDNYFFV